MPKLARRALLGSAAGACAAGVLRYPAGAAEFTYKVGNNVLLDHPESVHCSEAVKKIADDSGGRLQIQLFPNSSLGSDLQMLSQCRLGALEFLQISCDVVANVCQPAGLSTVNFAFAGHDDAYRAMDGPLGAFVRGEIAKLNLYAFEKAWDSGFKQIMNNSRPVVTPEDLRGLKLRVPPSQMQVAMFKALGASPTPVDLKELYTSLQTHLVDGAELAVFTMESSKYYEVQKYLSLTNHLWTGYVLLANGDAWQRLPKNLRDIVDRRFNEAALAERADITRSESAVAADLRAKGMLVNQADSQSFRAAVRRAGLYAQWRDAFGSQGWSLLEKSTGKLT